MNYPETYSQSDYEKGTKREAKKLIARHIERIVSANDIKSKSPEWYLLYGLKTAIDEDKS